MQGVSVFLITYFTLSERKMFNMDSSKGIKWAIYTFIQKWPRFVLDMKTIINANYYSNHNSAVV